MKGNSTVRRRVTVRIDDDVMFQVAGILGTIGASATVNAALHHVLVADARQKPIEQLRTMDGLDLDKSEIMAGAWAD